MSTTVDVNVLVYAADTASAKHRRARALLEDLATSTAITYLFWPVLLGYVRIATHPAILRSPLSMAEALGDIDDLVRRPQVIVVGEGRRFWPTFVELATSTTARGNHVPDTHIVALMAENGVDTIWTGDRDFRRFSGITVKDPFDPGGNGRDRRA